MLFAALIACGLFAADTAIHLSAVALKKETLRRATKVLLMPLLAVSFIFWRLALGLSVPWIVVAALMLGCAGDTFLLNHHHRIGMPLGLASFAAGHVLYIIAIERLTPLPAWWLVVLLAAAYGTGVAVTYKKLRPFLSKAYRPVGLFYMLLLSTLSAFAAACALTTLRPGAFVVLAGTLLFMLSDSILSFEIFRNETRGSNLKVMAPYIAAQALIAAGLFLQIP